MLQNACRELEMNMERIRWSQKGGAYEQSRRGIEGEGASYVFFVCWRTHNPSFVTIYYMVIHLYSAILCCKHVYLKHKMVSWCAYCLFVIYWSITQCQLRTHFYETYVFLKWLGVVRKWNYIRFTDYLYIFLIEFKTL